jgi:serine/threonine protein kinase
MNPGRTTHHTRALAATLDALSRNSPDPANDTPARIGRFVIVERVGEGGMGQVFSAYDPELDRKVALKLVRDLGDDAAHAIARVKQEAQALARVSHPNVVHVYEAGEASGRVFIAMEFVDGCSLADWQRSRERGGAAEVALRLRVFLQAAAGLVAAHGCGLIHRDFKPDNVLVGNDGRVRVADFGLARLLASLDVEASPRVVTLDDAATDTGEGRPSPPSGRRLTQAGAILGTPGYMSPEQVRGVEADERSDQFSFCAALYESLYGAQPYPGAGFLDYAGNILSGSLRPPPPSDVPLVVQQAILRGLSIDPEARFPSMSALITALESGLAPESEPLITRTDRLRIGLGLVMALVAIEVSNGVVMVLTHSQNSLVRGVAIVGLFVMITMVLMRRPPWPVRHLGRYRRMTAFFMSILATFFFGRVAALSLAIPANTYYTFETITLAGMLASESIRVGRRHLWLALAALAYAPMIHLWPGLRALLYNLLLATVSIASVYLHMRQGRDGDEREG